MRSGLDLTMSYALAPDLIVAQRDEATVQIGTEAPRRALIAGAPAEAAQVLRRLAQSDCLAASIAQLGSGPEWAPLFEQLLEAGMLVPVSQWDDHGAALRGERRELIHQHDPVTADRILTARGDAIVTIEGIGAVGDAIALLLNAVGVGRVYRPDVRPAGRPHIGVNADADRCGWPTAALDGPAARRIRRYPPAPQVRPNIVVLTEHDGSSRGRAAELVAAVTPHLAVQVSAARAIIGPLVLPGISACLNCLDRHRTDADPCWEAAHRAIPPSVPGSLTAHVAAAIATRQILDLIDGERPPQSVNATIECATGGIYPSRRPWALHERCGCRALAGQSPGTAISR